MPGFMNKSKSKRHISETLHFRELNSVVVVIASD